MYEKIYNPKTGRKVNIFSKLGRKIIKNYLQYGGNQVPFVTCRSFSSNMKCTKTGKDIDITSYNKELDRGGMGVICSSDINKALVLKVPLSTTHNNLVSEEETGHNEIYEFLVEKGINDIAAAPGKIEILNCTHPDYDNRLALHKQRVHGFDLGNSLNSRHFANYSRLFKIHPLDLRNEISDKLRKVYRSLPGKTKIIDLKPSNFMYGLVGVNIDPAESNPVDRKVVFIDYRILDSPVNRDANDYARSWVFDSARPLVDTQNQRKMRERGILQREYGILGTPEEKLQMERWLEGEQSSPHDDRPPKYQYKKQETWSDVRIRMFKLLEYSIPEKFSILYNIINNYLTSNNKPLIDIDLAVLGIDFNTKLINLADVLARIIINYGEEFIEMDHHQLSHRLVGEHALFDRFRTHNIYAFVDSVEDWYRRVNNYLHDDNVKDIIFKILSGSLGGQRPQLMILYDSLREDLSLENLNIFDELLNLGVEKKEVKWFNSIFKLNTKYVTSINRHYFRIPNTKNDTKTKILDKLNTYGITKLGYQKRIVKELKILRENGLTTDLTNFPSITITNPDWILVFEIPIKYPFEPPIIQSITPEPKEEIIKTLNGLIKNWFPQSRLLTLTEAL